MRLPAIIIVLAALQGCAQYTYFGRMEAPDSANQKREIVVYWTKTERTLWFDTVSGGVRLLTECSTNTVDYEEKPEGIVFLRRPEDVPVGRHIAVNAPCGSVLGATHIEALDTGALELTIHCRPDTSNEFAVTALLNYLQAREAPYQFHIERAKSDEIPGGAPKPRACRR